MTLPERAVLLTQLIREHPEAAGNLIISHLTRAVLEERERVVTLLHQWAEESGEAGDDLEQNALECAADQLEAMK